MTRALTRAELDELANLLADGGGIMPSALTGYLTACLSAGDDPSQWIPGLYEGDDPRAIELMEALARALRRELSRGRFTWPTTREEQIIWCGGYFNYVESNPVFNAAANSDSFNQLLFPIALAGGYVGFEVEPGYDRDEIIDGAIAKVPDSAAKIFWWLERARSAEQPPKTGRNEPCPCGSGKKYKRCCLN